MKTLNIIAGTFAALCATSIGFAALADQAPATAAALFDRDHVWNVQLSFAADQWAAMEPKEGGAGWAAFFRANGRNYASAEAIAGIVMRQGDRGRDGKIDRREFADLAGFWFDRWDHEHAGFVDRARMQAGLEAAFDPEGAARPGSFPLPLRGAEGKRNGLASVFGIEFKQVHARLAFEGRDFADVGVRFKGNGTYVGARGSPKRSFKLDLNDYAAGTRLAGESKFNLHNRAGDAGFMTEAVAYALYRDAGVPAPRTAFARVTLTAPPKFDHAYLGLYSLVENVDGAFAADRFGARAGAIFKPAILSLFADLGDRWDVDYAHTYDPKTAVSAAQARRVIDFSQIVTYAGDAEFDRRLPDYIDLDELARFMAATVYLSNIDGILHTGQNYYLYLDPRTQKFNFIPWDMDGCFGQIFGQQEQLAKLNVNKPWVGPNRFLERVFGVPAFKKAYLARLDEFARTVFEPARVHKVVDAIAAAIRPAVEAEAKDKLGEFDRSVAEPVKQQQAGGIFAIGHIFASKPPNSIKRFVDLRTPAVLDQLAGKTAGEPATGFGGFGERRFGTPGATLVPVFMKAADADKDGRVTRVEFVRAFIAWFDKWDIEHNGGLTEAQLRAGLLKDVAPPPPAENKSIFGLPTTRPTTRPTTTGRIAK